MNLDARLRKLESNRPPVDAVDYIIVRWIAATKGEVEEEAVYFADDFEPVTATAEDAARRLAERVTFASWPVLFFLKRRNR